MSVLHVVAGCVWGLAYEPTFPTLLAFLDEKRAERLWRVWCPCCLEWHIHGAGKRDENPFRFLGHRVAHCSDASPLLDTGYILVFGGHWGALTAEQRRYGPCGKALYQEHKRKSSYGALSL